MFYTDGKLQYPVRVETPDPLFARALPTPGEEGYTFGRDAGRLVLSTPTAIMDADILADVINGERQTIARHDGVVDGYRLSQHSLAMAGTLALGEYNHLGRVGPYPPDIRIGEIADAAGGAAPGEALPAERVNTAWFDADRLTAFGLGGLEIGTRGAVSITGDLTLAAAGSLSVTAPTLDITATVTARSGSISATNLFQSVVVGSGALLSLADGEAGIRLGADATLDVRGLWANGLAVPEGLAGLGHMNGGG